MEPGDIICAFFGASVTFALREGLEGLRLIAECYIHGVMNGEVMSIWKNGMLQERNF